MDDVSLMDRIASGDDAALRTLLRRHGALLRYVIAPILPDARDREECFADVSVKLWQTAGSFPSQMSPEPPVPPQCCAPGPHFAGICSGNSTLPFRKVPSCENRETERPQACRFPENKNILSTVNVRVKRRRF